MNSNEITIVLADDHPFVRKGVRELLENEQGFSVVGEAGSGEEAIELTKALKPDLLILDITMQGISGLEVTRRINNMSLETTIIILSMHANEVYVLDSLRAGAIGYVLKNSPPSILIQAINEAAAGRLFLGPPLSERAVEMYIARTKKGAKDKDTGDLFSTLTKREQETFSLVIEGQTSSEIGKILQISPRTVETHRSNLMKKLGIHNKGELFRFALEYGLMSKSN